MNRSGSRVLLALLMLFGLVGTACAAGDVVDYIGPKNTDNPPPAVPLNTFARFEISPITMDAPYAGQEGNEVAKNSIPVSYTHLRAHETPEHLVCRLLLEK